MANELVSYQNIVPLLAPVNVTATATATGYVDLKTAQGATLFVYAGVITASADATGAVVVKVEAATAAASASNEVNVEFKYRLSAATGTNTWGAVTSASAGADFTVDGDGKIMAIAIDPSAVAAALEDARFIRATITPAAGATATNVAAWLQIEPRYKQTTMVAAS